jgi:phospholipid transport system substrate-binding protein
MTMFQRIKIGNLPMLTRRVLLTSAIAFVALPLLARQGMAQPADPAGMFVDKLLHDLTTIVNGNSQTPEKQAALAQIVDRDVDIGDVARFCLGHFWRMATPDQQRDYMTLFHSVLLRSIMGNIGGYQGVSFTIGRSQPREDAVAVSSMVTRPGNQPDIVDWLVSTSSGSPKIIDVIAEGTSLRLTQRSDYASFLGRNSNNVQVLIDAMRQQVGQPG